MDLSTLNDLLARVQQASHYLGNEINTVVKDHRKVRLTVALAFPDLYEIGTSHFGIQILYHMLNRHSDMAAERVFAPGLDMERALRAHGAPLVSLETHTPLNRFDILGFSLLYELNYTNMLNMLNLGGVPWYAAERAAADPLVIAGGPCTCNPAPVADFFDAIVIGDGEAVVEEMMAVALGAGDVHTEKGAILDAWSRIEGVYVPARHDGGGKTHEERRIRRAVIADLNAAPFPDHPVLPYGRPIHDRLRLELARGCTRGCRFCQAGMIYRPVRERTVDTLLSQTQKSLDATGYEDISLLSLSTGDYTGISSLMEQLMARCEAERIALSLPSLRAGTLTPELMKIIKRVRKTGFTLAPEAGSQRLRDVINKNITEEDLHRTVTDAFALGWQLVKLYFMIGLPTETPADHQAIIDLVGALRDGVKSTGRKGKFNVSVGVFVPKPHTPFQWCPQIGVDAARDTLESLKRQLNMPGVQMKWQNPAASLVEGVCSRGDRRLSRLLVAAYAHGCRLDGWSDHFDIDKWMAAMSETGVDPEEIIYRQRPRTEPLPWDIVDIGVTRSFLADEWEKAVAAAATSDCRTGKCHQCGVCDFDRLSPRIADVNGGSGAYRRQRAAATASGWQPLCATFEKIGPARFFGHLELIAIMSRALRRAGIPMRYTEGFHPKPKLVFSDPLPVGMESRCEAMMIWVEGRVDGRSMAADINRQLPEGLRIAQIHRSRRLPVPKTVNYRILATTAVFDRNAIVRFADADEWPYTKRGPKGKEKTLDLKTRVDTMRAVSRRELALTLHTPPGPAIRPGDILRAVFNMGDADLRALRIIKEETIV